MQIYAYNLLGQRPLQKDLFRGRSLADRMSWWLFKVFKGVSGVRRRVSAEELLVLSGWQRMQNCITRYLLSELIVSHSHSPILTGPKLRSVWLLSSWRKLPLTQQWNVSYGAQGISACCPLPLILKPPQKKYSIMCWYPAVRGCGKFPVTRRPMKSTLT